jgi:hypothetical protein
MTTYGHPGADNSAQSPETVSYEHVDLDGDPFADDLSAQLAERAPRRVVTRVTVGLGILALLAAGFVGGAQVQKHWGKTSTQAQSGNPFANLAGGGFPQVGASGFPGAGTGQQTGGGTTQTGDGATTGTVKLIDGKTIYIETADGRTVTVSTGSKTSVAIPAKGSLKDLKTGSTVTVDGKAGTDGAVNATKITKVK